MNEVALWGSVPDTEDEGCRLYLEATAPEELRVVIVRTGERDAICTLNRGSVSVLLYYLRLVHHALARQTKDGLLREDPGVTIRYDEGSRP